MGITAVIHDVLITETETYPVVKTGSVVDSKNIVTMSCPGFINM